MTCWCWLVLVDRLRVVTTVQAARATGSRNESRSASSMCLRLELLP